MLPLNMFQSLTPRKMVKKEQFTKVYTLPWLSHLFIYFFLALLKVVFVNERKFILMLRLNQFTISFPFLFVENK